MPLKCLMKFIVHVIKQSFAYLLICLAIALVNTDFLGLYCSILQSYEGDSITAIRR